MKRQLLWITSTVLISFFAFTCNNVVLAKDYIYAPTSNYLHIIDCETDTVMDTVEYNAYINEGEISNDGKNYYFHDFHTIFNVSTETNTIVAEYNLGTPSTDFVINDMEISPDDKKIYISAQITKKKENIPELNVMPPQLVVYDIEKEKVTEFFEIPDMVMAVLTLKDDPSHLILVGYDIFKFDLNNGEYEMIKSLSKNDGSHVIKYNQLPLWHNCAVNPGNSYDPGIFTEPAYSLDDELYYLTIDRTDGGTVSMLKAEDVFLLYSSIVSPNKKYLYAVMDELVKVDFKTGETLAETPVKEGTVYSVATTSDGSKVYVGPAGNQVIVYDAETLEELKVIKLKSDGFCMHRISK